MSGGALAAKHHLLNSTSQISPRVLRSLLAAATPSPRLWAQVNRFGKIEASSGEMNVRHVAAASC